MLIGLTIFFFIASLVQLYFVGLSIQTAPVIQQTTLLRPIQCPPQLTPELCLSSERMNTAAILEANIVQRRYHQAAVLLMGRVWYTYLGFVTGMVLALVGAAFILGQLQMPASELEAKTPPVQMTLRSASPGLTLCVLGVMLMIVTFVNPQDIKVADGTTYFGIVGTPGGGSAKPEVPNLVPQTPAGEKK
jgi:hypothetical protein